MTVEVVGVDLYGILCYGLYILVTLFLYFQISEHLMPTVTAELAYYFVTLILLNAAGLEFFFFFPCFCHSFLMDVLRLFLPV